MTWAGRIRITRALRDRGRRNLNKNSKRVRKNRLNGRRVTGGESYSSGTYFLKGLFRSRGRVLIVLNLPYKSAEAMSHYVTRLFRSDVVHTAMINFFLDKTSMIISYIFPIYLSILGKPSFATQRTRTVNIGLIPVRISPAYSSSMIINLY